MKPIKQLSTISYIKVSVFVLLISLSATAFSETIAIDDESFTEIPSAAQKVVKELEAKTIKRDELYRSDCSYIGTFINLGGNEEKTDMIISTEGACNWGASSGPVIILISTKNGGYEVAIDARGYFVNLGTTLHGKYPNEKVSVTISGGGIYSGESFYVFTGEKYKRLSSE